MISPHAIVDPSARIAEDVEVGPFSVIGADVEIGPGTRIGPHVTIMGPTRLGSNNQVMQFASLGDAPQDISYRGEPTRLEIGDGNVFRESCTVNRGTVHGGGTTRMGNNNYVMAYAHVAHDCRVGSHVVFANGASLGGHVVVGDHVVLGGFALIHQFVRVGAHSFCAMGSGVSKDVPPFMMVAGHPAKVHGINSVGLKRRGFADGALRDLRNVYRLLYQSGLKLDEALVRLRELASASNEASEVVRFIEQSKRSIVR